MLNVSLWGFSGLLETRDEEGEKVKDGKEEPRMTGWWEGLFPACSSLNGKRWNAHSGSPSVSREREGLGDR